MINTCLIIIDQPLLGGTHRNILARRKSPFCNLLFGFTPLRDSPSKNIAVKRDVPCKSPVLHNSFGFTPEPAFLGRARFLAPVSGRRGPRTCESPGPVRAPGASGRGTYS